MDAVRYLLDEVQRLRVLVCAYRKEDDPAGCVVSLEGLYEALELSPAEGGAIVEALLSDGLLERASTWSEPAESAVQLSRLGRERLESYGSSRGLQANRAVVSRESRATV